MPADGWAICVQLSVFKPARLKSGALYTKPRYSARNERCLETAYCAHAVHKRGSGFGRCTRETATKVAGGIEDKGSGSGESVGLQSEKSRQFHDCCATGRVWCRSEMQDSSFANSAGL